MAEGQVPGEHAPAAQLPTLHAFDIQGARERLSERGGYEVVHSTPGIEIGVYVLVAPEPDQQSPHADDEVYIVLEGRGTLEVEGERTELEEGKAAFVAAGAQHRFVGYESLTVLVIFDRRSR